MDNSWRPLNETEFAILTRMLAADFPGAEVFRKQLPGTQARDIVAEQSIELRVRIQVRATTSKQVPVKAHYFDTETGIQSNNEARVNIRLHIHNGLMSELEFYKDDGTQIHCMPIIDSLQITTPDSDLL